MITKKSAYLLIAAGAVCWGVISIFVKHLYAAGFTPVQVVAVRAISALVFLSVYIIIKNRQLPRIKIADSKYFIGTGVISVVLMNWCMFSAIKETSIPIATILLYTAPAFVTIFSRILFKELLTPKKILALLITLSGCAFVSGFLPGNGISESASFYGLMLGLGSGLFYATYSIFGKFALSKYDSLTVTFYTFIFASLAILPFSGLWELAPLFSSIYVWINIIGLGFISTMMAYLLYTKGLASVESSRASIIATIEPVVATLVSYFVFREMLGFWQYVGIVMVIAAVILVQELPKRAGNK